MVKLFFFSKTFSQIYIQTFWKVNTDKRKHLFLIYYSLLNSKIQTVCHSDPACPPGFSLKIRPNYVDYFSKRRGLGGEILGHLVAKASWLNYCMYLLYYCILHPYHAPLYCIHSKKIRKFQPFSRRFFSRSTLA